MQSLLRLAGPLAIVQGGNQLMAVVDTAIVGRLGARELGAVGLANGLYLVLVIIGIGTMMALDPLISQAVGAGDAGRARALVWQGVWLALGLSVVLVPAVAALPVVLPLFGIEESIVALVRSYLAWRLPGIVPALALLAPRSYLQAHHLTRMLLASTVAANVVNLLLTLLLVFGGASLPPAAGPLRAVPALGVAGSALATSVCLGVQLLVIAAAVARRRTDGPLVRRPDPLELRRALHVGVPVGLHFALEVALFALVGVLAGGLGAVPLAAHQVALTLASLSFTLTMGLGTAASVHVGHAIGAGDTPLARRRGLAAYGLGAAFMGACGLLFVGAGTLLARALTDQLEVVEVAVPLLVVAAVFQISDGTQAVGAAVLRGAGDTRVTLLANLGGHWLVGLPVALGLAYRAGMGVIGLWWGLSAGLTAVTVVLLARFLRITSRTIAPLSAR